MPPGFLEDTPDLIPRLLILFAALLIIWLAKRLLSTVFYRMLRRLLGTNKTSLEQALQDTISIPVNLLTMALGLAIFAQLIQLDASSSLFVERLLRTLILMAAFTALYKLIGMVGRTAVMLNTITGLKVEEQLVPFIRTGLRLIILALALIAIVQEWGYDVGSLIAGLGLGGLAFALAAQERSATCSASRPSSGTGPSRWGTWCAPTTWRASSSTLACVRRASCAKAARR